MGCFVSRSEIQDDLMTASTLCLGSVCADDIDTGCKTCEASEMLNIRDVSQGLERGILLLTPQGDIRVRV
jgi:hypothetical protein